MPVRQVVVWGGRSWLEALPHIQCEVTMCESAVIRVRTSCWLLLLDGLALRMVGQCT